MMMPALYASGVLPPGLQGGPSALEGASARLPRDGGQGQGGPAARRPTATGPTQTDGVRIMGQAPSLSTSVFNTLGTLNLDDVPRFRLDPLTGEPVETDPLTGQPMTTRFALTGDEVPPDPTESGDGNGGPGAGGADDVGPDGLTEAERAEVRRLQAIDQQVRQHEAAHKAAGLGVTGPASFTYVTGPDGRQYAVAGEVSISANVGTGSPEQAVRDLEQVKAAALAPADPSSQDRAVAAAANAALARAEAAARDEEEQEQAERQNRNQGTGATNPFAQAAAAYGSVGALAPGGGTGTNAQGIDPQALFSLVA